MKYAHVIYVKSLLQTFRNKLAYFLRHLQTSRANNTRISRIKNAKVSGYCFYMNTNRWGDFQTSISVPLSSLSVVSSLGVCI